MWGNMMLPWQRKAKHGANQASPPHLNSNLHVRQAEGENKVLLVVRTM